MRTLTNPRAVADRLRTATSSLTDPHDVDVARQYIHELEAIAREQELKEAWRETEKAFAPHAQSGSADDERDPRPSGQILPLTRSPMHGHLAKVSAAGEHPGKWVLRLDTSK